MYIVDEIAYAGTPDAQCKVSDAVPYGEYKLLLSFNDGTKRLFDFTPLLNRPAFLPLVDRELFAAVTIDHGVPTWNDGEIDISPDYLYQESSPIQRIS